MDFDPSRAVLVEESDFDPSNAVLVDDFDPSNAELVEEEEQGRLSSAAGSFVKGAGEMASGMMKGSAIEDSQAAQKIKPVFDAIDSGDIDTSQGIKTTLQQLSDKLGPESIARVSAADIQHYIDGKSSVSKQIVDTAVESGSIDDPKQNPVYQKAEQFDDWLSENIKTNPEFEKEFFAGKLPRGFGSMSAFMAGGILGKGAGMSSVVSPAVMGSLTNSSSQFEDALNNGASIDQAFEASDYGSAIGLSEAAPIASILNRMDKGSGGAVKRTLIDMAKSGTEEAMQETFQQVMGNLVASDIVAYDPDRKMWEGSVDGATVGFTTGALTQFLVGMVGGKRAGKLSDQTLPPQTDKVDKPVSKVDKKERVEPTFPSDEEIMAASEKELDSMMDEFLADESVEMESKPVSQDRRKDEALRKKVADMSKAEQAEALLTSEVTGTPNKRAFQEYVQDNPNDDVMYGDIDDFKPYNEKYTHQGADQVLKHIGKIKMEVAKELGVNAFHRSGDEFLAAGNKEDLEKFGQALQNRLRDAIVKIELEDGTIYEHKGIGFSYGVGNNEQTAEKFTDQQKQQRKDAGLRTGERDSIPISQEKPRGQDSRDSLNVAAEEAATSPKNNLPEPSEAQKEAGNYKKGHLNLNGHQITIENPKGSKRRPEWPPLKHHYGYIKGTVGKDKDHIDVFMSDKAGDKGLPVFVVDQIDPKTGKFDEHKVMMGFESQGKAAKAYKDNYEKGWEGLKNITQMSQEDFKAWLRDGDTKKPAAKVSRETAKTQATDTPAFRKWFGDSKVVDSKGKPLVVYHGSGGKFNEFKKSESWGDAYFFSSDKDYAKGIAKQKKGNVIEAYVSLQNPKTIEFKDYRGTESIESAINEGRYDGVIVNGSDGSIETTVAFNPNQIKSTKNKGAFDKSNPNILYANPIEPVYKAYQKVAKSTLRRVHDAYGWKFTPLGKLPAQDLYLKDRYETLGKVADTENISRRIYETFKELDAGQAELVYQYFTTKDFDTQKLPNIPVKYKWKGKKVESTVRKQAETIKKLIDKVGQNLVKKGLLSEEAYQAHQDAYLPRVYLKHIAGDGAARQFSGGKKPSSMGYLKGRKDIPKDVREIILGEITDPGYLASKSLGQSMRDLAILDWFDNISQNKDWAMQESLVNYQGRKVSLVWLKSEADRIRKQIPYYKEDKQKKALAIVEKMDEVVSRGEESIGKNTDNYRQVPDSVRYGHLRGMYVRTEIYNDIVGIPGSRDPNAKWWEAPFDYGGLGTKATQIWKMSKVALNPPTQIRNFLSNGILLHLSGVGGSHRVPKLMIQAIQEMRQNGKYWRIAKKYGITASTFSNNELIQIERALLDYKAKQSGKLSLASLKNMAGIVAKGAGDLYQLSEGVFKTAKIIDAMKREGMSESDAVLEAQKWLYDYSLVPKTVRYYRNAPVGVPFLTFYYKTLPRMIEVAATAPHRFSLYFIIPAFFSAVIAEDYDVEPEDVERLKMALPHFLRDHGHLFFLPYKDKHGRWRAFDFSYLLPWSMYEQSVRNLKEGELNEAVQTLGIFGGPSVGLINYVVNNKDSFTGKEIVNDQDPPADQVMSVMNYLWSLSMPTWMTDNGFLGKMQDAGAFESIGIKGEVHKRTGEPKLTIPQATLRLFGMNIYPIEPESSRRRNISFMTYEIKLLQERKSRRLRDKNLTAKDKQDIRDVYKVLIDEKRMQIKDYRENSRIHPNLKGDKPHKKTEKEGRI